MTSRSPSCSGSSAAEARHAAEREVELGGIAGAAHMIDAAREFGLEMARPEQAQQLLVGSALETTQPAAISAPSAVRTPATRPSRTRISVHLDAALDLARRRRALPPRAPP